MEVADLQTGNAAEGQKYFSGAGRCSTCHSATGDLAGIARRFDSMALQQRWLGPRGGGGRGGAAVTPRNAIIVRVTLPSGETVSGRLDRVEGFEAFAPRVKENKADEPPKPATPVFGRIRRKYSNRL